VIFDNAVIHSDVLDLHHSVPFALVIQVDPRRRRRRL